MSENIASYRNLETKLQKCGKRNGVDHTDSAETWGLETLSKDVSRREDPRQRTCTKLVISGLNDRTDLSHYSKDRKRRTWEWICPWNEKKIYWSKSIWSIGRNGMSNTSARRWKKEFDRIQLRVCYEEQLMKSGHISIVIWCVSLLWKEIGCRKDSMISNVKRNETSRMK